MRQLCRIPPRHASVTCRPFACHAPPPRHALPLVARRVAPSHASPIVLPRHRGTRFGPAVNGGDSVVGGRVGWSVSASAGASAGSILSL